MDIPESLGVLRRGLALTVLGAVVGVGLGVGAQSIAPPTYSATSRELVAATQAGGVVLTPARIASYVVVASSGLVLQSVIDRLALDTTVDALADRLTVTAPPSETSVIEITATASTPREAQAIAAAVSDQFADVAVDELEVTSGSATPPVRIVSLEEAALPSSPDARDVLPVLVVGAVGLVLGLLLAVLRQVLDRRVRSRRDIAAVTDVPVVGRIVADRAVWAGGVVARIGSRTAIADRFRELAAEFARPRMQGEGAQTIVVTATGSQHGATTVAANLAVALANTAASVVVVDADLRTGALSRIFGLQGEPGLTEVLSGGSELATALRWGGTSGLTVLPAGSLPVNPGELLATRAMHELLVDLRGRFEFVVIDSPAIASVTDAAVLGSFDSATLLVAAQGTATRLEVEDAVSMLDAAGGAPIGIVLDSIPPRRPWHRRAAEPAARRAPEPDAATVAQAGERDRIVAQQLTELEVRAATQPPLPTPAPAALGRSVESSTGSRRAAALPSPESVSVPKPISATAPADQVELRSPVHRAPAADPAVPVFDPPLPAELQFTGVELPIGRRRPKHQADGVEPDAAARIDPTSADAEGTPVEVLPAAPVPTASRFAPDPTRYAPDVSVFATARPPRPGTEGQVPTPPSTVVTTVSIATSRSAPRSATPPPPISRILPSSDASGDQPEPVAVRVRPNRPTRPPMPPLDMGRSRSLAPNDRAMSRAPYYEPDLDDTTISPARVDELRAARARAERSAVEDLGRDEMGSLLGEIGGVPRVEVVATRPIPIADLTITPAHRARESYEQRSRELERAAEERLHRERRRLEAGIREQLDYGKRELESVLQNRLEDTVVRPSRLELPGRRRRDDAADGPADD